MKYSDFKKSQVFQTRCSVCGHALASTYDESIHAFPIFHPAKNPKKIAGSCESFFYESLLRLYQYLNEFQQSITCLQIINKYDWKGKIIMKKETLAWWLARGYLDVDDLQRIIIPPPVETIANQLFVAQNLDSDEELERAIEMLKGAFRCIAGELEPVPPDKLPFRREISNIGEAEQAENKIQSGQTHDQEIKIRVSFNN